MLTDECKVFMHYYKRNLGDYAKKAGRLTMLQHGAYTLLIDSCYDREIFPTLEQALEWTWASTEAEIEAVKFVLSRFFVLDKEGQYVQDRILEELLNYHKNADINKRIADEREAKRREKSTNRAPIVNEPPPNQEPLTINQEPLTNINTSICPPDGELAVDSKLPDCEHKAVIDLYHQTLPTLRKVEVWNETRKGYLRQRWREVADELAQTKPIQAPDVLEWWDKFFNHVGKSKFLMGKINGRDGRQFTADLEWILKPSNFAKIVEGKYHGS
tara:strand:- start:3286 stop:4101 length:816 start_codon:yes stop_codon:yes gene_type:complete